MSVEMLGEAMMLERIEQLETRLNTHEDSTEDVQAVRRQVTAMRQSMKRARAPGKPLGADLPGSTALKEIEE